MNMMNNAVSSRRRGFTLVELLVVIGIIAILIGVLLPALSAARRQSATVKCLSNLRQLAYAFQMYAGSNKNALPVIRQDFFDYGDKTDQAARPVPNWYWTDMLLPYAQPKGKTVFDFSSVNDADAYKASTLWCPAWVAEHPELDPWKNSGSDRFRTGYSMNMWPSFRPNFPNPDALPPKNQCNYRSTAQGYYGRYYKKAEWTDPANRVLVADSTFWYLWINVTNAQGALAPQVININTLPDSTLGPGYVATDRYRHGKYPGANGATLKSTGGLVSYNILYVDGHAITSNNQADAYRGIRMKYP
jgi:prepilin-type N-terminal cleavage/methylation domain-containing protein/prepilin-type processing-associated H-X9-DG protein